MPEAALFLQAPAIFPDDHVLSLARCCLCDSIAHSWPTEKLFVAVLAVLKLCEAVKKGCHYIHQDLRGAPPGQGSDH